ncbi:MAG: metallophosphatase family protein [Treponema sp.]|jgi:predicted phosphodiesterase|nr:metallophosphatase family protein [Treponema sp.]
MKLLILSDIHANLSAFEAILKKEKSGVDLVICLGDLVGYGPEPNECITLARQSCDIILGGNHDLGAAGKTAIKEFSSRAGESLVWTMSALTSENKSFLAGLDSRKVWEGILLSHGGPGDSVWSYILSEGDAQTSFRSAEFAVSFFGHTHLPSVFLQYQESCTAAYGSPDLTIESDKDLRMLINPGSVGFPRDAMDSHSDASLKNAAARYAFYDTVTGIWQFKRLEYDLRGGAKKMKKLGLWK